MTDLQQRRANDKRRWANNPARRVYSTSRWRKLRVRFLQANPLCERCSAEGRTTAATVVHHRKKHEGNEALAFEWGNLAASCKSHHDKTEGQVERRGYHDGIGADGIPLDSSHPFLRERPIRPAQKANPDMDVNGKAHSPGGPSETIQGNSFPPSPNSRKGVQIPHLKTRLVSTREKQSPPPTHLQPSTKLWWSSVIADYVLEPHHLRLLQLAAESWDTAQGAREILCRDGMIVPGREGGVRAHPAVAIERDAKLSFARLVRELDLDGDPQPWNARPPALRSNRRG